MTREEAISNLKKLVGFSPKYDEAISTLFPDKQSQLPSDAKKDLWEELDAYICNFKGKLSEEELGRLRLVAEHFYLCGKNPNVHLIGELPADVEEAAEKFARFYDYGTCDGIAQECFKAGAEYERGKLPKWRKTENPHPSYGIVTGDDGWDYLVNRNYEIQIAALNRLPKEEEK